jgi:Fe2+ transport system protein FeoA
VQTVHRPLVDRLPLVPHGARLHERHLPALRLPLRTRGPLAGSAGTLGRLGAGKGDPVDLMKYFGLRRTPGVRAALRVECASWADGSLPAKSGDLPAAGPGMPASAPSGPSVLDLAAGEEASVESMAAGSATRLGRLSGFGLAPGARLRVLQTRPTVLVEVGGTLLALEADVAAGIKVGRRTLNP